MVVRFIIAISLFVLLTNWAKAGWRTQSSGTMAWLYAVHFVDNRSGWISGSKGTLLATEDGGDTWTPSKRFTNDAIRDVYFADPLQGWLLCERPPFDGKALQINYLMTTRDGGKTWQNQESFQSSDRVTRLIFRDAITGCVAGEGGYLSCTDDGGKRWKKHDLPVRYLMIDGRFLDDGALVLAGGGGAVILSERARTDWLRSTTPTDASARINSLYFLNQKTGWAAGADGSILFTANGGHTWRAQYSTVKDELRDVWFADSELGYAVGDKGVIIRTQDGGLSWKEETRPNRHRLESLSVAGSRIFAVGFGGTILTSELRVPVEAQPN